MISHNDQKNEEDVQPSNSLKKRYTQPSLNTEFFAQNSDEVYTKCIERNHNNININQLETFFNVNPIMERTKRVFDQQGMKALLLDNIVMESDLALRITSDKKTMKKKEMKSEKV